MAKGKKTIVIGATPKEERYANRAVRMLKHHGHEVLPLGWTEGEIAGEPVITEWPSKVEGLDTVTLYLNPVRQRAYYDYIIGLQPKRIVFNPGTENPDLEKMAGDAGIETIEGCTLVMLSIGNY